MNSFPSGVSLAFALFYVLWFGVGLYALVAIIRGMRALVEIAERLGRIEQIMAGRTTMPPSSSPAAETPHYTRYDLPDERAP